MILTALAALLPGQEEEIKPGDIVKVKTLNTGLRSRPSYLAKPHHTVERGTALKVVEVRGLWVRVSLVEGKKEGYVPKSSLMPGQQYDLKEAHRKIDPDDPNSAKGSAGTEAAAAKGFNPQAEAKRRKDDGKIDAAYKELDRLQSLMPRKATNKLLADLEEFRREGGLGEFRQ